MTSDGKVYVPPIKIQGIKTKIVPMIWENASFSEKERWVEPFMGSGVVGFNVAPKHALFADSNPHIIEFYNRIKEGKITSFIVRGYLEKEGAALSERGEEQYYFIRERFNQANDPLDFLFLNRSDFNGMIRFNKENKFNVPYGHKPERFAKAYVTKIVHQVAFLEELLKENDWQFLCQPFERTIALADEQSFIYCDPPYIGRHVDYYDSWDENQERSLHDSLHGVAAKYMLSTWDHNDFRRNEYIDQLWTECHKITKDHFYHVGASEKNRHTIVEAILTNYEPTDRKNNKQEIGGQIGLY